MRPRGPAHHSRARKFEPLTSIQFSTESRRQLTPRRSGRIDAQPGFELGIRPWTGIQDSLSWQILKSETDRLTSVKMTSNLAPCNAKLRYVFNSSLWLCHRSTFRLKIVAKLSQQLHNKYGPPLRARRLSTLCYEGHKSGFIVLGCILVNTTNMHLKSVLRLLGLLLSNDHKHRCNWRTLATVLFL